MDEQTKIIVTKARKNSELLSDAIASFMAETIEMLPDLKIPFKGIVDAGRKTNFLFLDLIKDLSQVLETAPENISEPFILGKAIGNMETNNILIGKLVEKIGSKSDLE